MKFFKKSDLIIVGILLGVSLVGFAVYYLFWESDGAVKAEFYYGREKVAELDMWEENPRQFSLEGHEHVVFEIFEDGSVGFIESDCPDKVCIHTGRLKLPGQSAACLPNDLILRISEIEEGAGNNGNDVILN